MMIAYLEKVEPKQRMLRFYALHIAPTLFGEWSLVREWGRIGSPETVRLAALQLNFNTVFLESR